MTAEPLAVQDSAFLKERVGGVEPHDPWELVSLEDECEHAWSVRNCISIYVYIHVCICVFAYVCIYNICSYMFVLNICTYIKYIYNIYIYIYMYTLFSSRNCEEVAPLAPRCWPWVYLLSCWAPKKPSCDHDDHIVSSRSKSCLIFIVLKYIAVYLYIHYNVFVRWYALNKIRVLFFFYHCCRPHVILVFADRQLNENVLPVAKHELQ